MHTVEHRRHVRCVGRREQRWHIGSSRRHKRLRAKSCDVMECGGDTPQLVDTTATFMTMGRGNVLARGDGLASVFEINHKSND